MSRKFNKPKPVTKIVLSDQHSKVRMLIVVLLFIIGIGAFAYAINTYFSVEPGWTEININALESNKQKEFTLGYDLGKAGISAKMEKQHISKLCKDTLQSAYEVYNSQEIYEGVHNVAYINQHPNEIIEVDTKLYQAFEILDKYNNRNIYLAPVYIDYRNLFFCNNDSEVVNYDPNLNEEVREYFERICFFAQDKDAIQIELLSDHQVKLVVSDEYLNYAKEIGFTDFIDFFWMKNAFIVDDIAQTMIENGYTHGMISSFDGFVRNLDDRGGEYSYPIICREEQVVYPAARMSYNFAGSIVAFHNYPLSSLDTRHFYEFSNGEIRTAYIDPEDGICKSSINDLLCYSKEYRCAEILMQMIPVYINEQFDTDQIDQMKEQGIYSVYAKDYEILYNDPEVKFDDLFVKDQVEFKNRFLEGEK